MLALGAEGAVYGTRFLLTDESFYNQVQKQALLEASSTSTVRTKIFDEVRCQRSPSHAPCMGILDITV